MDNAPTLIYNCLQDNKERGVELAIGKNVQFYRTLRQLNGKELAARIGCSVGALSHIEKENRQPSIEMLYKIADALNVSVINLVMDPKEIERFYYDDAVKAYHPGSEALAKVLEALKGDIPEWANAKRIAIVNLDDIKEK